MSIVLHTLQNISEKCSGICRLLPRGEWPYFIILIYIYQVNFYQSGVHPNCKNYPASSRNTILMTVWIMPKFRKPLEPFKIYEKIWADDPEMIEAKYQEIQNLYPQIGFFLGQKISDFLTKQTSMSSHCFIFIRKITFVYTPDIFCKIECRPAFRPPCIKCYMCNHGCDFFLSHSISFCIFKMMY